MNPSGIQSAENQKSRVNVPKLVCQIRAFLPQLRHNGLQPLQICHEFPLGWGFSLLEHLFDLPDLLFNFASILFGLASILQARIIRDFACRLFDFAFHFIKIAFNLILRARVHFFSP
jgi:hypothetical protein